MYKKVTIWLYASLSMYFFFDCMFFFFFHSQSLLLTLISNLSYKICSKQSLLLYRIYVKLWEKFERFFFMKERFCDKIHLTLYDTLINPSADKGQGKCSCFIIFWQIFIYLFYSYLIKTRKNWTCIFILISRHLASAQGCKNLLMTTKG